MASSLSLKLAGAVPDGEDGILLFAISNMVKIGEGCRWRLGTELLNYYSSRLNIRLPTCAKSGQAGRSGAGGARTCSGQ